MRVNWKRVAIFLLLLVLVPVCITMQGCAEERERLPGINPDIPIASFGSCNRCFESWAYVRGHATSYTESMGCFPLCEDCWEVLTPEERLPYYRRMWKGWFHWADTNDEVAALYKKWKLIEKAVLDGK